MNTPTRMAAACQPGADGGGYRRRVRYGLLGWVVLVTTAAYLVRTAVVLLARHRASAVATFTDRWWAWTPLVVVLVAVTLAVWPLGVALTAATVVALTRSTAAGSPFRPRR
jgi:hypothetical protein